MTKILLMAVALAFAPIALTGCNTMEGAGQDISKAGQKVQGEAAEHKHY